MYRPRPADQYAQCCDLALEFSDALLHSVDQYVRLQGELLTSELKVDRVESREATDRLSIGGAVSVTDISSGANRQPSRS